VIVKGWSAVIDLISPNDDSFVEIDSATSYGDVAMAVEIDTVRTLKKIGKVRRKLARRILQINPARVYGFQ
jgi:hypothetical protein